MSKKPKQDRKRVAKKAAKPAAKKAAKKKVSAAGTAAHAAETAKRRKPVDKKLPGLEQPRNAVLERLCQSIGTQREVMNAARTREKGDTIAALQEMQRREYMQFTHAGVELVRVPGADKLRVHLVDTDGDVEVGVVDGDDDGAMQSSGLVPAFDGDKVAYDEDEKLH